MNGFKHGKYVVLEDYEIGEGTQLANFVVVKNSKIGRNNKIWNFVNIYNSTIGDDNVISSFCEIGGSEVGNHCKIEAQVFMPLGVKLGDYVFIGPAVKFANDKYPKVVDNQWEWKVGEVAVEDRCSLGIATVVLPRVRIGTHSFIAAGSLVVSDVPPESFVMGRPAHVVSLQVIKELGII